MNPEILATQNTGDTTEIRATTDLIGARAIS